MIESQALRGDRSNLTSIVHQIRKRWRMKLALRGAAFVLAGCVLALVVSAYGLERLKFSPGSIIAFRVAMIMITGVLAGYFFVLPQWRRVTDEQVALYLEECEPSLETAILSAIEAEKGAENSTASPALARRLVEQAIDRCAAIEHGRRLEAGPFRRYSTVLATTAATALLVFLVGPAYLRHGASALLLVMGDLVEASPYRIDVKPGNTTVPRGSDQIITAKIQGFTSEQAELLVRKAVNQPFEHVPMVFNQDTRSFEGMLFDLPASIDYFVDSGGVRSSVFTMHAADLPYVKQIEMEYVFPAYTGLAPRKIEHGGDIAVLQGTQVRMRIVPTMSAPAGRIVVDGDSVALTPEAGAFIGQMTVNKDGFYKIELQGGPENKLVAASPQYTIDVLQDQPPTVSIAKPGRDSIASPIEEFSVEARAEDDFGVKRLDLVYSVNGGPEQTKTLVDGKNKPLAQVSAAYTFYLEELKLVPGDSVSYYARAVDNDGVHGGKSVLSDIYFVRIRKFDEQFRAATSQGGGGGGGGGGGQMNVDALSQQQRQIISATHNIVRDKKAMTAAKVRESLVVVGLSQQKLREQVEGLVARMNSRLVTPDPAFLKIAELLPKAAEEMKAAEQKISAQAADAALPPENRALQQLQKAEEEYEKQVSSQRGGGGGGGGAAGSISEDLADLFKQDLDKLANQYETAQSAQQQQSDQQVDALMEKLRELARRQEQEAERQRQQALAGQMGQGGGDSQRQLAEQAEEAARQLEKLSRDRNRPDLAQAAQQMRQAADAMRRAAASGSSNAGQAQAALGQLRDAQRRLEQEQNARGQRDMQDAQQQADELAREQRDIASEVAQLGQNGGAGNRGQRAAQLSERKNQLESKMGDLEKQLDKMSGDMRRDEKDASRKLQEAADSIRDNKLKEKVRYTNSMLRGGQTNNELEGDISSGIDALRNKLGQAQAAMGQGKKNDRMANNLDRARNLVRGVDSMQQQMREGRPGQNGQQGQQGQQGRDGQQNQNGQGQQGQSGQGQQGQNGQQGQQGQSGQQGQQGQNGQQGQGGGQQGQGQQAGNQQGQGGGRGGNNNGGMRNGGDGTYAGGRYNGDYWGGWGQRVFNPGEIRQFRDQTRYWAGEAQQLRDQLRNDGVNTADLDEILRQMRQLDDDRVYKDPKELERLETEVGEGLKRFEFGLRRKAEDAAADQPALASTDEVPRGFRDQVEEYFRALSKLASSQAQAQAPSRQP
jgi:hypothetical protein